MKKFAVLLISLAALSCDKKSDDTKKFDPESKLLGERLLAQHGEGVLASPVVVAYDTGFVVGRESVDENFAANVEKLGVEPASRLSLGQPPVHVTEYFSEQDVEFAVSAANKFVVTDSNASLAVRLLLGKPGLEAVRVCGLLSVQRVCKGESQLRMRMGGIPATAAELIDRGLVVSRASIKGDWAVFDDAGELSDDVQLELTISDGMSCNFSKWVIDPRDSCVL